MLPNSNLILKTLSYFYEIYMFLPSLLNLLKLNVRDNYYLAG
jgi:hypothetical protein